MFWYTECIVILYYDPCWPLWWLYFDWCMNRTSFNWKIPSQNFAFKTILLVCRSKLIFTLIVINLKLYYLVFFYCKCIIFRLFITNTRDSFTLNSTGMMIFAIMLTCMGHFQLHKRNTSILHIFKYYYYIYNSNGYL